MRYRASKDGTIGKGAAVRRVRSGDVFELPAGIVPGKWMEEVVETVVTEPKPKKAKKEAPVVVEPAQDDAPI
jgi:hypothetical protein